MRRIFNIKIALILTLFLSLLGCKDEFLEETNPNNLSTGSFWKSILDLEQGLVAAYKGMASPHNVHLVNELSRSDLAWSSGWQRPNNNNEYYLQTFNNASNAVGQKFAALYRTIFRANQVIVAVEDLTGTFGNEEEEERASVILAEARFIRGYSYFILHNSFNGGAVPILDFVPNGETYYNSISPENEVRAFYLTDLEFAAENLPTSWNDIHKGRVTAGAAVALIGQSHLYVGNYDEAATYFKRVIEDFGYSLTPDIGSNFTTRDELNEESILELVYSTDFKNELNAWDARDVASTSGYQKLFTGAPGQWFGAVCANWLILEYRNDTPDYSDPRNIIRDENGAERFRKFSLRTSASVALVDDDDTEYYGSPRTGQAANFNVKMTAFWRKHTNWDLGFEKEEDISPGKVRSGINERLIRLAEIYLQYAEAVIKGGTDESGVEEALLYINKVRRRSAVQLLGPNGSGEFPGNDHDNANYTAQTLMEHLMYKEYPLELSAEGDGNRNIDLRRWGVKAERFRELASRRYYGEHYEITKVDGTKETKWESIVTEVPLGDPLVNDAWNEFQEASVNYNDAVHAYWPISNVEELTNPELYN